MAGGEECGRADCAIKFVGEVAIGLLELFGLRNNALR